MKVRMHRVLFLFLVIIVMVNGVMAADSKPAEPKAIEQKPTSPQDVLKQRDFATMLVTAFHWQQGLPKKPTDQDYLAILSGQRTYRFEAEDHYSKKTDNVSVKEFELYGPFSGKGWVSGVSVPTTVRFKVLVPLEGEYLLSVAGKGSGQVWSAGGKSFKINSGERFREEMAGKVNLKAGEQEITAEIPPEGGVDYLVLEAPHLQSVEPLDGWRLDEALTAGSVAEIAAALLDWERGMPEDKEWKQLSIAVSEAAFLPPSVSATTIGYLGPYSAKQWVRAGREGAVLQVPLIVATSGSYDIKVRYMGEKLVAQLDGKKLERDGKPYLDWIDLGLHRLRRGAHTLILKVVPNGGVDVITLEKRRSTPADYLKLSGIDGAPSDTVTRAQAEKYLTSFMERFKERR